MVLTVSYQVLARKYRPQTFAEVVGQGHVIQTLRNAIDTGRIAHAFLFVGPRGIGKTSTARILAKALNCTDGPKIDFDPADEICQEIAEGRSLDVIEIDGASNNGVEQVRDLRDNVRYAPTRGKFKIYIIDEVHMLSMAAFNALLKTLEEPPAHVKFIFATTEVHKVPATILSRCQRFDLKRITDQEIAAHLGKIAKLEGVQIEDAALRLLARQAEGGLRDAESSLDQLISFCGGTIRETDVLEIYGLTSRAQTRAVAEALQQGRAQDALQESRRMAASGKDLVRLVQDLLRHFRNILLYQISPDIAATEMDEDDLAYITQAGPLPSQAVLLAYLDELIQLENRLKFALVKEVIFEIGLLRLCEQREKISLEEILKQLTGQGSPLPASSAPATPAAAPVARTTPPPSTPPPSAPAPLSPAPVPKPAASPAATPARPADPGPAAAAQTASAPAAPAAVGKAEFENDPLIHEALKRFEAKIVQIQKG
jgi:DNA polymerase-3 subunit gamma/tau